MEKEKKVIQFHQLVRIEKGPVNATITDFLKGDVYRVPLTLIEAFERREFEEIPEFISALEEEKLIIACDEGVWVPGIRFIKKEEGEDFPIRLELEQGVDMELIGKKFRNMDVAFIIYYGEEFYEEILPGVSVETKKLRRDECSAKACVNSSSKFDKIDESRYGFCMEFNSCWGYRLAVTKENAVKPCMHSSIVLGYLDKETLPEIMAKAESYWTLNMDKIEKCKICEMRYICTDCRVVALEKTGDLLGANPLCLYNPATGTWQES